MVDSFNLYITDDILKLITDHTNLHGRRNITEWKDIDATDLQAYIGLVLLTGVYRSHNESTRSLWDENTGRAVFRATMSLKTFKTIGICLRFEDKRSRPRRLKEDKLAAFRDIWEMWTARLPLLYKTRARTYVWTSSWFRLEAAAPSVNACLENQPNMESKFG